jgi:hypothetical protein
VFDDEFSWDGGVFIVVSEVWIKYTNLWFQVLHVFSLVSEMVKNEVVVILHHVRPWGVDDSAVAAEIPLLM